MTEKKNSKRILAVEQVAIGHPDAVCDVIADSLVDAFVKGDSKSRCGIEVMMKDNIVVLGGEIFSKTVVDCDSVVRSVFKRIVYPKTHNLSPDSIKIINLIGKQSMEIHNAVDVSDEIIAGSDQGFMCGYATNETDTFMPLGCYITKKICEYITRCGFLDIGPDAKSQVVIEYDGIIPTKVVSILVSTMHQCDIEFVRNFIEKAIRANHIGLSTTIYEQYINNSVLIDVNPAGTWNLGGSISDCGMCNRKLACNQYSSASRISGGGIHGKDISKMDYSGNMMCRYIAKNIVAAGLANTANVDISYSIGVVEPTSINIELDINKHLEKKLVEWVKENVGLEPHNIIKRFDASVPRYACSALNGNYGKTRKEMEEAENQLMFPWEKLDLADKIRTDILCGCKIDGIESV